MQAMANGSLPIARLASEMGAPTTVDKGADFANYFCTYGFLYHQKEMLSDQVRMDAYHNAIRGNRRHFHGKVVLDVGTGSGILAIWSAQAGARKVYAVEATDMASHARNLVSANGFADIVEVIQGSIEDINLPEKVDIIISEWMGYFLLRESMFDSVIHARDRWLKPSGTMFPSFARMFLAPIRTRLGEQKSQDYEAAAENWNCFSDKTNKLYGVNMDVLTKPYLEEQRKYYLQTSLWNNLYPSQILAQPVIVKQFDCHTATVEELSTVMSSFRFQMGGGPTRICGFAGWFDVQFQGSPSVPVDNPVELTTAPSDDHTTHWGQQVFLLHPAINVEDGDVLEGTLEMSRSKENHRLLNVKMSHALKRVKGGSCTPTISTFYIE